MRSKKPNWEEDFNDFLSTKPIEPSHDVSRRVRASVFELLNPSSFKVFSKLVVIVFCVGLINLLLCPQFGLGFVRESFIGDLFMSFGYAGCKIACGAFFLGTSLFVGMFLLKQEEIKVIRTHRFLQITLLSSLFLAGFVAAGADIFLHAIFFWLFGSIVGGLLSLEGNYAIRRLLITKAL